MILRKVIFLVVLFQMSFSFCQFPKADLEQFLAETQISSGGTKEVKIIWWIPDEFLEIAFRDDKSLSETQKEDMLGSLSQIFFVGVVHSSMVSGSDMESEPYKTIKMSSVVNGQSNVKSNPLSDSEISVEVEVLLAAFKPLLKNLIGEMGENFHFYAFDAYKDDKRIADPLAGGKLDFKLFGEQNEIKTPLCSFTSKKEMPS